jgi:MYXO-CTERM domain-containing protein
VSDPNACTNQAPVVTMGPDQEVQGGAAVTLSATATDADGDALTRTWTQLSGVPVTLTGETFTAPQLKADASFIFELTVSDGHAQVGPLSTKVLVKTKNRAPVASAPASVSAAAGARVTIDGAGTDPDGDALTYQWSQVSGPAVTLTNATAARLELVAPKEANQTVVLQLVVRDEGLASEPVLVELKTTSGCGCGAGVEGGLGVLALLALARRRRRP